MFKFIVRTALLALIGFMPTQGEGAIGSLDYTSEERKALAKRSLTYTCPTCKIDNAIVLPMLTDRSNQERAEAKELAAQIQFKVIFKVSLIYWCENSERKVESRKKFFFDLIK